jgi:hypothetical protein
MRIEILTKEQFKNIIYSGKSLPLKWYSKSLDGVKFFSFNDIIGFNFASTEYDNSLRFVVAYDSRKIYGVTKFAFFSSNKRYSISYCATGENFKNRGICSKMIFVLCKYFKETYT